MMLNEYSEISVTIASVLQIFLNSAYGLLHVDESVKSAIQTIRS